MKNIFLILFFFYLQPTHAQYTDIATINENWISLHDRLFYSDDAYRDTEISGLVPFQLKKTINAGNYYKQHHLFLFLKNSGSHSDSLLFFCGHWLRYQAFRIQNGIRTPIPETAVFNFAIGRKIPMSPIVLKPGDRMVLEIIPDTRNFNYAYVQPYLVRNHSVNEFGYAYYINDQKLFLVISFIFMGVLLVMFLYGLISWSREKNVDYLFYGIYVLFFIFYFTVRIGTMFITDYAWLKHNLFAIHFFQVVGYIFYAYFLMSFLNLKKEIGILYKMLKYYNYVMIAYLAADGYLNYFSHEILLSIFVFTLIRYTLLILSVATIIILFRQRKAISHYIAYGLFFLFFFGLVSLLYTPVLFKQSRFYNFFDMRILWYQVGIFIELIFFTIALQHKTNLKNKKNILFLENIKIENEKKEFESLMMVMEAKDKERTRIAQEIHDDIGSGLTNIRLLSEIAKHKNAGAELVEIDKISASASELIDNMNEIIWSMNSKNDYLANLIAYIRRFVVSYFENVETMDVKTKIPPEIPNLQISGDFRRSVFLVVKESLHNILKHAKATAVLLEIDITPTRLKISIQDNGVGVVQESIRLFSNGLKNMRERVENLEGNFSLTGSKGTLVQFDLPLAPTT